MATINSDGKVAYLYNQSNDTWYAIGGAVNTNAEYTWTADQTFSAPTTFETVATAQAGINNFQNPAARDLAIPTPTNGIVCFVRQEDSGTVINQIQYYYNGSWIWHGSKSELLSKLASYTIALSDAGRTITFDSGSDLSVTVPANSTTAILVGTRFDVLRLGTGELSITPEVGVTIRSKDSNLRIAAQYSGATLLKLDTNTWALVGDLKA